MKTKSDIGKKITGICFFLMMLITVIFGVIYYKCTTETSALHQKINSGNIIVSLNEIKQLAGNVEIDNKVDVLIEEIRNGQTDNNKMEIKYIQIFYLVTMVSLGVIFIIVYVTVIRPFAKLEKFASQIAAGNLDIDLMYERVNLFGQFTWAFDHMGREIKNARQCEREAIENNKTIIATLSHDIKTPIASLRTYSEALEGNMDSTPERRNRYIDVIIRKCDEVTKITNDIFLHSLHNLDKLVIKKEQVKIHEVIKETVYSMEGDKFDIEIKKADEAIISGADKDRIAQILENLINNSRKYAPGKIEIMGELTFDKYILNVRDYGKGILPEDMPFIFNKFYRGKNKGNQQGSGLGLFIVKYIMEQMDGEVQLENLSDGLNVILKFPIS